MSYLDGFEIRRVSPLSLTNIKVVWIVQGGNTDMSTGRGRRKMDDF